ncbi:MAG: SIS domain-containing protein [Planctomycetota bacterium]|nr:SIS domain-containing protein [Planctomycetota bacterium]MDA1162163.1 SIS domain-containing protein [Planctomycetota bacterium]
MNGTEERYSSYSLVREMLETPQIVSSFDSAALADLGRKIGAAGRLLMTGEGSSRLFPAKGAIAHASRKGWPLALQTEAGRQAAEYDLSNTAVFALSNSGKTAEVIRLFKSLQKSGHQHRYSLSATPGSPLEQLANEGFVLSCGKENAVAATKSVVEQALFYRAVLEHAAGESTISSRQAELAAMMETALTTQIDAKLVDRIASAGTIYWAGRNDGVTEELTLKTNEITRKKSDYLEGTYAVHGIEEVMDAADVVLWVEPYEESESKFRDVLCQGVGLEIIAISSRQTSFPTIQIPDAGDLSEFVQIAAGWNVLVEVGVALSIDLDKPERARKVGNEFVD